VGLSSNRECQRPASACVGTITSRWLYEDVTSRDFDIGPLCRPTIGDSARHYYLSKWDIPSSMILPRVTYFPGVSPHPCGVKMPNLGNNTYVLNLLIDKKLVFSEKVYSL